jgi:exopolysaccharide biosynthesis polyprenyl glycosylphosphotransferase
MSRRLVSFLFLIVPDILLLYVGLWLAILFRYHSGLDTSAFHAHVGAFSVIYFFWLVVFFIHGLFELQSLRRYTGLLLNLISAMTVNIVVAITYFYLQPNLILTPRRFLLVDVAIVFVLLLVWHLIIKFLVKDKLAQGVYLFSFNNELGELEHEIKSHEFLGYRVLGHVNEENLKTLQLNRDNAIVLPDILNTRPDVLAYFYRLRVFGASFYNYKDFYELLLRKVYLSEINEMWFLENINYTEKRFYNFFKRLVDIVFGAVGLIVFLVSLPFCAFAIKLSSRGPVIFKQPRVGKLGKVFTVYKYRTMSGGATNTWTQVNDPRITRVGAFMRKSRIDELPQFINLIMGNISLVGPRPEQVHIVEELRKKIPFYDERHLVKPGITGWAQLNIYAGSLEETRLKLQYDLYYIKHRSLLFDLEIILKTLYYIFTWQGR